MSTSVTAGAGQYLTFLLGGEQYGVEILKVQEIRGYTAVTPIPNAPPHVKGVMNLRGAIIPVLDLRTRFGMGMAEPTPFTVIIVVAVGAKVVGLVVDAVSEVLDVGPEEVQPPPELGGEIDARYMHGMTRAGERLVVLLDIEDVVGVAVAPAPAG